MCTAAFGYHFNLTYYYRCFLYHITVFPAWLLLSAQLSVTTIFHLKSKVFNRVTSSYMTRQHLSLINQLVKGIKKIFNVILIHPPFILLDFLNSVISLNSEVPFSKGSRLCLLTPTSDSLIWKSLMDLRVPVFFSLFSERSKKAQYGKVDKVVQTFHCDFK